MTEYIYATDGHEGHWLTGEEIVRCRDCKWFSSLTEPPECYRVQGCMLVEPDGFCAWGERKEGGA